MQEDVFILRLISVVCGHEFIGEVIALGESFGPDASGRPSLYSTLKIGDKVVAPFTVSCGECQYVAPAIFNKEKALIICPQLLPGRLHMPMHSLGLVWNPQSTWRASTVRESAQGRRNALQS